MREVSTRACESLMASLEPERISPTEWLSGLPVDLPTLADPEGWIDWDLFAQLVERFEELATSVDPLFTAGCRLLDDPTMVEHKPITDAVHDLDQLYRLGGRLRTAAYYTNIRRSCERLDDGRYRIVNELPRSDRGCIAFFRLRAGNFRVAPRLLGLGQAEVEAQVTSHRGVYLVTPPREPLTRRLTRRRSGRDAMEHSLHLMVCTQEKLRDRRAFDLESHGTQGSEARAQLDAVAVPLLVIDLWGDGEPRVFGLNRRMELETGLRDRDVAGRDVRSAFGESDGAHWLASLWTCVEERRAVETEGWASEPLQRIWMVPKLDEAGDVVRVYVSSTRLDLTTGAPQQAGSEASAPLE